MRKSDYNVSILVLLITVVRFSRAHLRLGISFLFHERNAYGYERSGPDFGQNFSQDP